MNTADIIAMGVCPHVEESVSGSCSDCKENPSELSYSQGALLYLTHESQVEIFNWCMCEDNEGNENPYSDCPIADELLPVQRD